jgi:hypothetical protein
MKAKLHKLFCEDECPDWAMALTVQVAAAFVFVAFFAYPIPLWFS